MWKKIGFWVSAVTGGADWFFKESIKAYFFDGVVHQIKPWEASLIDWIIPIAFVALAACFLWLSFRGRRTASHIQATPAPMERDDVHTEFKNRFYNTIVKNHGSESDKKILLVRARADGIAIRNHPQTIAHLLPAELDDWISSVTGWVDKVIGAVKIFDPADAELLKTLGEVPAARVAIPNIRLGSAIDRARFAKAFREHDYRLSKLDGLLKKYGIGPNA